MSRTAIETFVDHWHAAMLDASPPSERDDVRSLPAALKGLLRQRRALFRLATNPLLCAMICALHYDRRDNLPGERVELYRACVEMLMLRDTGRKIVLDDEFPQLKPVQQQRLIQEFAYTLTRSGALDMAREDADKTFDYGLEVMDVPPETTGAKVCNLFTRRIRLLHEPVVGRVEFVHRTFQEYLAARVAYKTGGIDELLNHADDDQWRETIVLAAGMTDAQQSDRLLGGLVADTGDLLREKLDDFRARFRRVTTRQPAVNETRLRRARRLMLAVACLETCVERSPKIADVILQQAKTLFPPKNDDEARLLAAVGVEAVPLLRARPWYSESEAAACILALALIGGEEALAALREYAEDEGDAISRALGYAWDSFDRTTFAKQVLWHRRWIGVDRLSSLEGFEHLTNLTRLYLNDTTVTDLTALQGLPYLNTLQLSSTGVMNLTALRGFPQLTRLDLGGAAVTNLTALHRFPQLTILQLNGTGVEDLTALQGLSYLTTLYFSDTEVTDLTALQGLPYLTRLFLIGTEMRDLTVLQGLPHLTELYLIGIDVRDLTALQGLPHLTTLFLSGTGVMDLTVLQGLLHLTTLFLGYAEVRNLTVLQGLPHLTELHLIGIDVRDLTALQGLPHLTTLDLNLTRVRDLTVLQDLPHLTMLDLSGTSMRDLTVLQGLPHLIDLDLNHTEVTDLTPLQHLTNLTELNLNHTPVADLTPLQHLTNLRRLHIRSTQVRDLSPLEGLPKLKLNDARADDEP